MIRAHASLAVALLAACIVGCGTRSEPPPTGPDLLLVTEVPLAPLGAYAFAAERYPIGSRLVLLDIAGGRARRVLSEGLAAAGGAAVSSDGARVLFTGKQGPGEPFALYLADLEGGPPRVFARAARSISDPAWLPDGRVVCSVVTGDEGPRGPALALLVLGREGHPASQITFGAGYESDSHVLLDGRVVHVAWQPEPPSLTLFTVHPDGTGWARLPGDHTGHELSRPRQRADGELLYLQRAAGRGTAWRADWRCTSNAPVPLAADLGDVLAAEPAGTEWLLSVHPGPGGTGGVFAVRGETVAPLVPNREGWAFVHAVRLAPRPRPRGHLSIVDRARAYGSLLAVDARQPQAEAGARVRLSALSGPFAGGLRPPGRRLGEIPLHPDGSFFAAVPADVPLLLDLLDGKGRVVVEGRTPFWVRPNEVRGCVGCHEDPESAPPNRRPLAVGEPAVRLVGEVEVRR